MIDVNTRNVSGNRDEKAEGKQWKHFYSLAVYRTNRNC